MDKNFDPAAYESKWQKHWAEMQYFRAEAPSDKPSFSIMIPPPNVTGKLHIGHALQSTIQDLLVRWKRMQGLNALWLPGTDHAGIATQLMVERQLIPRARLGVEGKISRKYSPTVRSDGREL
jgi:valyl-tRNA synthetase